MVWVRCRLFKCIISQDIAFFDGMRTGDLTQRLTGDVRAMVSPIQFVLSSTISNLILLVGGVVMPSSPNPHPHPHPHPNPNPNP